jgi:hypothetical protein
MERLFLLIVLLLSAGCNQLFTNAETSEIGSMSPSCLDSLAWGKLCREHSVDSVTHQALRIKLEDLKNHFIKPDYVLYFREEPEEIIGCDWYSIRVVYNRKIADQVLDGLDPLLGNDEQKRVRNRVLKEILKYQCTEGQKETLEEMRKDVPYAESHKNYPLK